MRNVAAILFFLLLAAVVAALSFKDRSMLWRSEQAKQNVATFMSITAKQVDAGRQAELEAGALPFVAVSTTAIEVTHALALPELRAPLELRSYFSLEGNFVALESAAKVSDPFRMKSGMIEELMRGRNTLIVSRAELTDHVVLDEFWAAVAAFLDVNEIQECSVSYVAYQFADGSQRPVFIANLWGPENRLGMPDELSRVLKNRIRIIYDPMNRDIAADNTL